MQTKNQNNLILGFKLGNLVCKILKNGLILEMFLA